MTQESQAIASEYRGYADAFQDQSVVEAYRHRPPYPASTFDILAQLLPPHFTAILDVGCGRGELARPLAQRVERVDAVDVSRAMIEQGKHLPSGNHPRLRWVQGRIEEVQLQPPYALVTAGASLHWMDWEVVLPRLHDMLTPRGLLAIVYRHDVPSPWEDGLDQLVSRYSSMRNYQPFNLIEELEKRHLFQKTGEHMTAPVTSTVSIEHYIASLHSRSSLSLDRMPSADAAAFDAAVRELAEHWSNEGHIKLQCIGSIVWGTPLALERDEG